MADFYQCYRALVRLLVEADVRGFAFAEKGGLARDTLELLLLVARQDTGEFTRFDQQFEMSLRPETRARYERDGFPITRDLSRRSRGSRRWPWPRHPSGPTFLASSSVHPPKTDEVTSTRGAPGASTVPASRGTYCSVKFTVTVITTGTVRGLVR